VRDYYGELTGAEVAVHVLTLQHSDHMTPQAEYLADEPILVVTFLRSEVGGTSYRKAWKDNNRGGETLRFGSVALEVFVDLSDIMRKPTVITGRIWDMDARKFPGQKDMGRVISEMGQNVHKMELIAKSRGPNGRDKWYGLLKSGVGTDGRKDIGILSIREGNIPQLFNRPESRIRGSDPVNLEPMELANENAITLGSSTLIVEKVKQPGGYQSSEWNKGRQTHRQESGYGIPPSVPHPFAKMTQRLDLPAEHFEPTSHTSYHRPRWDKSVDHKERARSRSRSRSESNEREGPNVSGADLANLIGQRLPTVNLLAGPQAAHESLMRSKEMVDLSSHLSMGKPKSQVGGRYGVRMGDGSPLHKRVYQFGAGEERKEDRK